MPSTSSPTPRTKACVECRQQKIRCDAYRDSSIVCSNCRRAGIECRMTGPFQRRKREPKAKLQQELDRLRGPSLSSHGSRQKQAALDSLQQTAPAAPPQNQMPAIPSPQSLRGDTLDLLGSGSALSDLAASATESRTIDGLTLPTRKLDDCFSQYFQHYHPQLPILDAHRAPNEYYAASPFLFWTIVAVGSQRYERDPTVIDRLTARVTSLALRSAIDFEHYLQTIRGLVILCNWPFAISTTYQDPSLIMSGIAMHLAVQGGLHLCSQRQDFTRDHLGPRGGEDVTQAELWCYCSIVCQRAVLCNGVPPYLVLETFNQNRNQQNLVVNLPAQICWEQKLHQAFTRAVTTLMQSSCVLQPNGDPNALFSLTDTFDNQLVDLHAEAVDELSPITMSMTRLYVRAFDLFVELQDKDAIRLTNLYLIANAFICHIKTADEQYDYMRRSPQFVSRTLSLAMGCILRAVRSRFSRNIDKDLGEENYFIGVQLMRKRSLQSNDTDARIADMLAQVWHGSQAFRSGNGTVNSLSVRVRCRGATGVVIDCYWYWRREFAGSTDPYAEQPQPSSGVHGQSDIDAFLLNDLGLNAMNTGSQSTAGFFGDFNFGDGLDDWRPEILMG